MIQSGIGMWVTVRLLHMDTDLDVLLNSVHEKTKFTMENNGSLPFPDTMIMRTEDSIKFKVYLKPTKEDDFLNYLSAHDEKIKSGVIIGFYVCALHICSQDYMDEEINYINRTFDKLG